MELALAVGALVIITIAFVISSMRSKSALAAARADRNVIYRNCFLRGLAGILACMAKADGSVAEEEEKIAFELFERMGLDPKDRNACFEGFRTAKEGRLGASYYASLFAPYSTRESRLLVYEILWDIVAADGKLDANEEQSLREMLKWLSLDGVQYDYNLKRHSGKFTEIAETARLAGAKIGKILGA